MAGGLCATAALLLVATPATAVVGGQEDTTNAYANVGSLQLNFQGQWKGDCTATLVDENVVVTAAHCVDFFVTENVPLAYLRITFDPRPAADSSYYQVSRIVVDPDWFTRPDLRGNSKSLGLAPPAEDFALIWLTTDVAGIDPAPIVGFRALDALDLTHESFTLVGYGLQAFATGSIVSHDPSFADSGNRNYKNVSIITEHEAFDDRFVKITSSTCFGDSGGPLFHGRTIVAISTWTLSARCAAASYSSRLDAPAAQAFLESNLS